jgi:hypothetical protein
MVTLPGTDAQPWVRLCRAAAAQAHPLCMQLNKLYAILAPFCALYLPTRDHSKGTYENMTLPLQIQCTHLDGTFTDTTYHYQEPSQTLDGTFTDTQHIITRHTRVTKGAIWKLATN